MAQMIIALRKDPATGRQNIIVKLDSDSDALPIEHERLHRQLVEKLLGEGLPVDSLGELVIERESPPAAAKPVSEPATKTAQPRPAAS